MIRVPRSVAGAADAFAARLAAHRDALEEHRLGRADRPAPVADHLVDSLVLRVPDVNPNIAQRGPDQFVVAPYEIFDDTPIDAETQHALDTLRATLSR